MGQAKSRLDDGVSDVDDHVCQFSKQAAGLQDLPQDGAGWHLLGNALHVAASESGHVKDRDAAVRCWLRAAKADDLSAVSALLLSNRAQARLRQEQPEAAACDAAAAFHLDPSNAKALWRLMAALQTCSPPLEGLAEGVRTLGAARFPDNAIFARKDVRVGVVCMSPEGSWWEDTHLVKALKPQPPPPLQEEQGGTPQDWKALKEKGNAHFAAGEWEDAARSYTGALGALGDGRLQKLLCNLSLYEAEGGAPGSGDRALAHACAAVLVGQAMSERAWLRRAEALQLLGLLPAASEICAAFSGGVLGGKFDAVAKKIKFRVEQRGMSTAEMLKVQKARPTDEPARLSLELNEKWAAMYLRNALSLSPKAQKSRFGEVISKPMPDFRKELPGPRGWPIGVSAVEAGRTIREMYCKYSSLPYSFMERLRQPDWQPEQREFLQRLGFRADRVRWYFDAADGDVCFDSAKSVHKYCEAERHDFSNQAFRREILLAGTTHVAVGFVDLGMLLTCHLEDHRPGPLNFVGYELSAYACAKSAVVWRILRGGDEEAARAALQVWFSSTWTKHTLGAFRPAARQEADEGAHTDAVRRILRHWARSDGVPLAAARAGWTSTHDSLHVAHMLRKIDRHALTAYELTGDFALGGAAPQVGSVCMWDNPDGTPPLGAGATVFSVVSMHDLGKRLTEAPNGDVVSAVEELLLPRAIVLAGHARAGRMRASLRHADVHECVQEIAALRPWTMSWSNVLDYFTPQQFHRMARAVSVHGDTMHFGYTMNWRCATKGVALLDITNHVARGKVMGLAIQQRDVLLKAFSLEKVFRSPPPQNPFNTAGPLLSLTHYKGWVDRFFEFACASGPCNVGNVDPPSWGTPLSSTGDASIHFTWTYDPDIKMYGAPEAARLSVPAFVNMALGIAKMAPHFGGSGGSEDELAAKAKEVYASNNFGGKSSIGEAEMRAALTSIFPWYSGFL